MNECLDFFIYFNQIIKDEFYGSFIIHSLNFSLVINSSFLKFLLLAILYSQYFKLVNSNLHLFVKVNL
jgi:hypothetical protein